MAKQDSQVMIPDEVIMSKIYMIRGQKVILDKDLAELYEVETKALKQAVKRNIEASKQQELEQKNRKPIGFKTLGKFED